MSADQQGKRAILLKRHVAYLRALRDHPDANDSGFYIWEAAALRTLLVDQKYGPVLLDYARETGVELRIVGPRPAGAEAHPDAVFGYTALFAGWGAEGGGYEMPIEAYLDTPILTAGGYVTPRRLVQEVANSEGAAHLGMRTSTTLAAMKGSVLVKAGVLYESFVLKQSIGQLADWAIHAIVDQLQLAPDAA